MVNMSKQRPVVFALATIVATILFARFGLSFRWGGAIIVGTVIGVCGMAGENAKYRRKGSASHDWKMAVMYVMAMVLFFHFVASISWDGSLLRAAIGLVAALFAVEARRSSPRDH
jgi:D-alanyl-lipoteichoic acid acyltransferase DltB (MBOAT superfamily)